MKELGHVIAARYITGWIRDSVVKGIQKADPGITDESNIGSKLQAVIAVNPGHIIREIVDRGDATNRVGLAVGLENEAKGNIIAVAVASLSEGLAGIAVAEIIDPVLSNRPGVASRQSPGVIPNDRRNGIRKPSRKGLVVV